MLQAAGGVNNRRVHRGSDSERRSFGGCHHRDCPGVVAVGKQVRPADDDGRDHAERECAAVGGIEKVLAAKRAGVHDVVAERQQNQCRGRPDARAVAGINDALREDHRRSAGVCAANFGARGAPGCRGAREGAEHVKGSSQVSALSSQLPVLSCQFRARLEILLRTFYYFYTTSAVQPRRGART